MLENPSATDANNATGGKVSDVSTQWQGAASCRVVSAIHKRLTMIDPSSAEHFSSAFSGEFRFDCPHLRGSRVGPICEDLINQSINQSSIKLMQLK
jgi:hypothetical protein